MIASVTHARVTKCPISVITFTRSPVCTPSRWASLVWIQSGLECEISFSHLLLPERVWISVGSRNVGSRTNSPRRLSIAPACTWLRM